MDSNSQPDPEGDVILRVGPQDDATSIRVSSTILILASPVFKATLSPNFAEGQASFSKASPLQLPLPEDDPEAMLSICSQLHYCGMKLTSPLRLDFVIKLAVLCDKYDLSRALEQWFEVALRLAKFSANGYDDWAQLLRCSQLFKSHTEFHHSSSELLEHCVIPTAVNSFGHRIDETRDPAIYLENIPVQCFREWPSVSTKKSRANIDASVSILDRQTEHLAEIVTAMERPVEVYMQSTDDKGSEALGHHISDMRAAGLWPIGDCVLKSTLRSAINKLDGFEKCSRHKGKRCHSCTKIGARDILKAFALDLGAHLQGLCLQCFDAGKISVQTGNCCAKRPWDHHD